MLAAYILVNEVDGPKSFGPHGVSPWQDGFIIEVPRRGSSYILLPVILLRILEVWYGD